MDFRKSTLIHILMDIVKKCKNCWHNIEQYRNMRYWLENDMRPVELLIEAIERAGIEPFTKPVRGGTDGSRLTQMGIPTPNIFTGMQNVHGPLEWVSLEDMAKATQVCVNLVQLWAAIPAWPE